MTEKRKNLTGKEIQNFIDDLDNSESFSESITSSSDSVKQSFIYFLTFVSEVFASFLWNHKFIS